MKKNTFLAPGEPLRFEDDMTKREIFAFGFHHQIITKHPFTPYAAAKEAVEHADALIAELAKGGGHE
jgi:hypothetical protein